LKPVEEGRVEFCIDNRRFRRSADYPGKHEQVEIWDGQQFVIYNKYYTHEQEEYFIDRELGNRGQSLLAGLAWPKARTQVYWWHEDAQDTMNREDWDGRAEAFMLTGKADYRGVSCYVLECLPKEFRRVRRWYIGVTDGLLRGIMVYEQGQLCHEYWTDQYVEVQPGWWFPTIQGYHSFERWGMVRDETENATCEDGLDYFIGARRDLRVTCVEVNRPLADQQFRMEFKEGVKTADLRFGGMVTYKYKEERTEEEWEQIRQEALQRAKRDARVQQALDARIGQAASAFPSSSPWLNSPALTWQDLRGKAVVLQFWGIGCGPCHNYIRLLKAAADDARVVAVGIHVPEDDTGAIQNMMARYKADGVVCVDRLPEKPGQGFGAFSAWFGVKAIPSWVVVGPNGNVIGHSMSPNEAFQMARGSLSAAVPQ